MIKIDFHPEIFDNTSKEQELDYFNHTGSMDDLEIHYEYKPKDENKR